MAQKFWEHLLLSTVNESAQAGILDEFVKAAKEYEPTEGVLAFNVGYAEPVFGDGSFVSHLRSKSEAAMDSFLVEWATGVGPKIMSHLSGGVRVRFEGQPIGSMEPKFPCLRLGLLKYKEGTTPEEIKAVREVFENLPSKFPQIKQISIGENYTEYSLPDDFILKRPDMRFDLGLIIGFSSVEDLEALTSDSNSEYMAIMMSTLPKFEAVKVSNLILA